VAGWSVANEPVPEARLKHDTDLKGFIMPYREGHLSIGVELQDDPVEIARKVAAALNLRA
jgi:hypothetical protein